jgi:ATP/maltotriose-dependent transcriptional regulator MalT
MAGAPPLAVRGPEPEPHDSGLPAAGKFHPPDPRREWVPRQRLIEQLAAGDAKLVIVHAPAGFGKTIAVAQWRAAETQDRAFAWVSLDPG